MKPYISIIIPTIRIGGLDILCDSLENQTFKDFELVLVDSLYKYRKDIVKEKAKNYSFVIKHIEPLNEDKLTATGYCRAMNTGFVNANGSIVIFVSDYTWFEPYCLQIHADFHKTNINYGFVCSYNVCKLPKLHNDFYRVYAGNVPYDTEYNRKKFVEQEIEAFDSYASDLNNGKFNNMMWSIFDSPIENIKLLEVTGEKDRFEEGEIPTKGCYLRNESYNLDSILNINGFNEALDGSHGWQDWEFAGRITNLIGTKIYHKPIKTITMIDCRTILYGRLRKRDVYSNEAIWQYGISTSFRDQINTWSLKDYRKNNVGKLPTNQ